MSSFSRSNTTVVEINILTHFTLQTNLQGRWRIPTDTDNSNNPLQVDTPTKHQAGLYRFYVTSTKGAEIEAIQLEIKITGIICINKMATVSCFPIYDDDTVNCFIQVVTLRN